MKTLVRYEPRKEVIIHEYAEYKSPQEMVTILTGGLPPGGIFTGLRWANGVLFDFHALPLNEVTTKEIIEGKLHWDYVSFTSMPKYQDRLVSDQGTTATIMNVSSNPTFAIITEFIKERFLKSRK
jgi:hypothetical protein